MKYSINENINKQQSPSNNFPYNHMGNYVRIPNQQNHFNQMKPLNQGNKPISEQKMPNQTSESKSVSSVSQNGRRSRIFENLRQGSVDQAVNSLQQTEKSSTSTSKEFPNKYQDKKKENSVAEDDDGMWDDAYTGSVNNAAEPKITFNVSDTEFSSSDASNTPMDNLRKQLEDYELSDVKFPKNVFDKLTKGSAEPCEVCDINSPMKFWIHLTKYEKQMNKLKGDLKYET